MTAAEYVALAKRAAQSALRRYARRIMGDAAFYAYAFKAGGYGVTQQIPPWPGWHRDHIAMFAELTPENAASEDALVRALLSSAITVDHYRNEWGCAVEARGFIAFLGAHRFGEDRWGATEAEAREALLDALLAEVKA